MGIYGPYESACSSVDNPKEGFCPAEVAERDCLRRTGRTPSGFEMSWTLRQCRCRPMRGATFCRAHEYLEARLGSPQELVGADSVFGFRGRDE